MSLGRIFAALLSAVLLVAAAVMGAFVAAVMFAIGLLTTAVVAARVWWLRRTLHREPPADAPIADTDPRVIDAEFTVVPERSADRPRLK